VVVLVVLPLLLGPEPDFGVHGPVKLAGGWDRLQTEEGKGIAGSGIAGSGTVQDGAWTIAERSQFDLLASTVSACVVMSILCACTRSSCVILLQGQNASTDV